MASILSFLESLAEYLIIKLPAFLPQKPQDPLLQPFVLKQRNQIGIKHPTAVSPQILHHILKRFALAVSPSNRIRRRVKTISAGQNLVEDGVLYAVIARLSG